MGKDKLKWAAIGLAVGIIGGGIGAAGANKWYPGVTRFETIQVQEIRIVDTAGNQVAELDGDGEVPGLYGGEGGGGMLTFYKPDGNLIVALGAYRDGGGLAIRNAARKSAAVLASGPDGGMLTIQNSAGNQVARLYADSDDGSGRLEILNRSGMLLAMVSEVLGAGQMEIYNTSAGGNSGERVLAILGNFIDGGAISFRDVQGRFTATVGTDRLGGTIRLWDKDGKRVFERP